MIDLYGLDQAALATLLKDWGFPAFRAKQLWHWIHDKGVTDFDDMGNLPNALRERLRSDATLGTLQVVAEEESGDGTVKRLYRLSDGQVVESVLMPYADGRRTACISSQAGCAMGCVFCATGQMGFVRNLTATEIFEQAKRFADDLTACDERLSNIVLMGMGEPFHNYDAVLDAIGRLRGDLGIGQRHITVSTVGLVPDILRFADEGLQVKLAISLHAANDADRSALLPVNRKWPIAVLMEACHTYVSKTKRRISFEWALIAGKTDSAEQAHELGRLLKGLMCHVNLIPLNPTDGFDGGPTDGADAARFVEILEHYRVPATLRVRRGIDINAGCGQLKSANLRKARKASEASS